MRKTYTEEQYQHIARITHIVGDQYNLLILIELLSLGEKSFNELRRMTNINQVTLSRKLSKLKEQGLVSLRAVGKEHHYSATPKARSFVPITNEILKLALNSLAQKA